MKNVLQKAKGELLSNSFVVLISLVLTTIPLPYIYNSIATILFVIYCLFSIKKQEISIQKELFFPIAIYILMIVSLFWTIDFKISATALTKEISFLVLPLCFFLQPIKSSLQKNKILNYFAFGMFFYALFYVIKASLRYIITRNPEVFFYHELVTSDVNAIHVSVYFAIAFFILFIQKTKSKLSIIAQITLAILLVLLSSKNISVIFFMLLLSHQVVIILRKRKIKFIYLILIVTVIITGFLFKIKDRFKEEIDSNFTETSQIAIDPEFVRDVSVRDAIYKDKFNSNNYFGGTALRVYQARIFSEMLHEDKIFATGYGLNAAQSKIIEKRKEHNLHYGYDFFNFHNQYIQFFAELGVVGLLLLLIMVAVNLKNAINNKDFIHFSFAILMISLFLTESFLSRQRGIVFFVMMYCVLNARIKENNSKNLT